MYINLCWFWWYYMILQRSSRKWLKFCMNFRILNSLFLIRWLSRCLWIKYLPVDDNIASCARWWWWWRLYTLHSLFEHCPMANLFEWAILYLVNIDFHQNTNFSLHIFEMGWISNKQYLFIKHLKKRILSVILICIQSIYVWINDCVDFTANHQNRIEIRQMPNDTLHHFPINHINYN